jgi:hypothetical protein
MRNIGWLCRSWRRKSRGRMLLLAAPQRKHVGEKKPRLVTKKTRGRKMRRQHGGCAKRSYGNNRSVHWRLRPRRKWSLCRRGPRLRAYALSRRH